MLCEKRLSESSDGRSPFAWKNGWYVKNAKTVDMVVICHAMIVAVSYLNRKDRVPTLVSLRIRIEA